MENSTKGKKNLIDILSLLVRIIGVIVNIYRAYQSDRDYRNQKSNRPAQE